GGAIKVRDAITGQHRFTLKSNSSAVWSPDSKYLACHNGPQSKGPIRLLEMPTGKEIRSLGEKTSRWSHLVEWSPNSRLLAAGRFYPSDPSDNRGKRLASRNSTEIFIWDTLIGKEVSVLKIGYWPGNDLNGEVRWSPGSKRLAVSGLLEDLEGT